MLGSIVVLVGLVTMLFGLLASAFGVALSLTAGLLIAGTGLILIFLGLGMISLSFYRRASADQAFVRTGQGGKRVVLDDGISVIPFLHNVIEINLKTMKLGVNPRGANALITKDNLRANVLAQFYIRVQADVEHILNAARSLGESSVNEEAVEQLVSEKLTSALRAISSQMDLFEIHTQRDLFAERVKEHVKDDLEANGLLLESVTISELDQTDPGELSDNNVFDAQGKRKITEITAAAAVERNNLERAAEQARKTKDVETRQRILALERTQAEAEAEQAMEIAKVRADRERESQEAVITQQRQIELARIEKEKQVQTQEILRQQALEISRTEQERAVQQAQVMRDQQVQTAGVERDRAVSVAERQKQIAVAEQEMARAKAEEGALQASAEREKASQSVTTVTQVAEAEREAKKKLIAAQQEIEQGKLRQQTTADVEAYTQIKQAEGAQTAAAKQAQARLQIADAEAQAREMVARGEKAQQMVAVEVARELVNVEQAKVAVERQQLENRQQFAEAGIQLEVRKLTIQADRDVQIEFAKALANFLSSGHMTLYGTPETATQMMDNMTKGFGYRTLIEGFVNGPDNGNNGNNGNGTGKNGLTPTNGVHAPNGGGDAVSGLLSQIGGLLQPALAKVTGGGNAPATETPEQIAKRLSEDPILLAALRKALAETPAIEKVEVTLKPEEKAFVAATNGKG